MSEAQAKQQFAARREIIPVDIPFAGELAEGEVYGGVIFDDNDKPLHHVILLPGDKDDGNWTDAVEWAKEQGGELPTRQELRLFRASVDSEFKRDIYWSNETRSDNSDYAWSQSFGSGYQYYDHKSDGTGVRARAVRRLFIQR